MNNSFGIVTNKCPQCGKSFERLSPEWVYKKVYSKGIKYFCSYKCWIAEDKQAASRKRERQQFRLSPSERYQLGKMLDEGKGLKEIARALKVTENCILYYRKQRK